MFIHALEVYCLNNYTWVQKQLHQIALSTQFMRETSFDAEKLLIKNNIVEDNHVFVAGLARSGTTILLNALFQSNQFASLSYNDMPFVLAPNIWSRFISSKQDSGLVERSHEDGIKISVNSPEAFEEVFWNTFPDSKASSQQEFKRYIDLITHKYQKDRYLSKNNQNIRRLGLISNIFPNSRILIPFRDPIQHANSLLFQHNKFIHRSKQDSFVSDYMKWIGHKEFGPDYVPIHNDNLKFEDSFHLNHWIEQWYLTYQHSFSLFQDVENITFLSYERLCNEKDFWHCLLEQLKLERYDFEFKESLKDVTHSVDNDLCENSYNLFFKLSSLNPDI